MHADTFFNAYRTRLVGVSGSNRWQSRARFPFRLFPEDNRKGNAHGVETISVEFIIRSPMITNRSIVVNNTFRSNLQSPVQINLKPVLVNYVNRIIVNRCVLSVCPRRMNTHAVMMLFYVCTVVQTADSAVFYTVDCCNYKRFRLLIKKKKTGRSRMRVKCTLAHFGSLNGGKNCFFFT